MPRRCSVYGCRSNYDGEKELTSTFGMPKNECLYKAWLENIPTDLSKLKNPIICIKHFEESCIIRISRVTTLKGEVIEYPRKTPKLVENAVPTIFPKTPAHSKRCGKTKKHNRKMDNKLGIKESSIVNLDLQNVRYNFSEFYENSMKMEIKEEPHSPDPCFQDTTEFNSRDSLNYVKRGTLMSGSDCGMGTQTETEGTSLAHPCSPSGTAYFPNIKVEIKEEHWWLEGNSTEATHFSDKIKDGPDVDLIPVESARVHTEGINRSSWPLFSSEELQKDASLKMDSPGCNPYRKCNSQENVKEVYDRSLDLKECDLSQPNCMHDCDIPKRTCNYKSVLAKDHKCDVHETRLACPAHPKRNKLIDKGIRPHRCEDCEKSFTHLSSLKKHKLIHEGKRPYKCEICKKTFIRLPDLKTHKQIHEDRKPYKCNICDKNYTRRSFLKIHLFTHEGKKPHKCETCEKCFTQLSELKSHRLIHEGKRSHICEFCGKSFIWLSNLREHMLIHKGIKPHKCNNCGKSFTRLIGLKRHTLVHRSTKPHSCEICKKGFTLLSSLKRHQLVHDRIRQHSNDVCEKKPHKCNTCGKSFTHLIGLKRHKLIHGSTRPHGCEICKKGFTQLSSLKRHKLIHEGIRPYSCDICEKGFTQLLHFRKHKLIHVGKKPNKCIACG